MNGIIQGWENFSATPFGAGVFFVCLVWLLIDIVIKVK